MTSAPAHNKDIFLIFFPSIFVFTTIIISHTFFRFILSFFVRTFVTSYFALKVYLFSSDSISYYYEFSKEQDYICSKPEDSGMHQCTNLPPFRIGPMICNCKYVITVYWQMPYRIYSSSETHIDSTNITECRLVSWVISAKISYLRPHNRLLIDVHQPNYWNQSIQLPFVHFIDSPIYVLKSIFIFLSIVFTFFVPVRHLFNQIKCTSCARFDQCKWNSK